MAEIKDQKSTIIDDSLSLHWHSLELDDVLVKLHAPTEGLTSADVAERLEKYGPNELKEKPRPTFFQLVLVQLNNFIVILLIVASVISAVLGDWIEAAVIMLIVVLNAILGVVQESRAEEALAALKKMSAPESQVMRDGQRVSVQASGLVPGDLVYLEAGNFVPADIRLIEAVNLRVEEAALTGESVPVQKNAALVLDKDAGLGDRKNTVFMGTVVNYGRGRGIVVSTGMNTQLGLIADMLQAVEEEGTPLQKKLDQLGKTSRNCRTGDLCRCFPPWLLAQWCVHRRFYPGSQGLYPGKLHDRSRPGDRCRPRRTGSRGHDQPGAGHARNGQTPCPDPPAGLGGNPWLSHGHLLR